MKKGILILLMSIFFVAMPSVSAVGRAPPFVVGSSISSGGAGLTHAVALNAGVTWVGVPGDFWLVCINENGATGGVTDPSGWSRIVLDERASWSNLECIYKAWNISDSSPITITTVNLVQYVAFSALIRGASSLFIPTSLNAIGLNALPDPPALLIQASASAFVISVIAAGVTGNACDIISDPSGFSAITRNNQGSGASVSISGSFKTELIGAEDPGSGTTNTACRWSAITFAFLAGTQEKDFVSSILLIAILAFALSFLVVLSYASDRISILMIAGLVSFSMAFVIYSAIADLITTILFLGIGILLLVIPLRSFERGKT